MIEEKSGEDTDAAKSHPNSKHEEQIEGLDFDLFKRLMDELNYLASK